MRMLKCRASGSSWGVVVALAGAATSLFQGCSQRRVWALFILRPIEAPGDQMYSVQIDADTEQRGIWPAQLPTGHRFASRGDTLPLAKPDYFPYVSPCVYFGAVSAHNGFPVTLAVLVLLLTQ